MFNAILEDLLVMWRNDARIQKAYDEAHPLVELEDEDEEQDEEDEEEDE